MSQGRDDVSRRGVRGNVEHRPVESRRVVKKVVRKTAAPPDKPRATQSTVVQPPAARPAMPAPMRAAPLTARLRTFLLAKRMSLPSLPRPDVRGRATDLRYGITDRVQDAADLVQDAADVARGLVADGWNRVSRRLSQLSSVQVVATVGVLLGLLTLAFGWGFYEAFHPRNGIR